VTNNLPLRPDSAAEADTTLPPIGQVYLLVSHIPFFRDADGRLHTLGLWFHDLKEHVAYLPNLVIACPLISSPPPEDSAPLDSDISLAGVRFIALPSARSRLAAMLLFPVTTGKLWRAIREAQIAHCGIVGWPFPPAWIVIPLARLLRRRSIIIVESADWRPQPGAQVSIRRRAIALAYELLGRFCLSKADLTIFTTDEYRRSMLRERFEEGHVIHASWINGSDILSDEEAQVVWQQKLTNTSPALRVLFAGRLERPKGVLVLLEALRHLADQKVPVELHILGAGTLLADCEAAARDFQGRTRIQILGTTPYGPPFFAQVRQYHAVVVPSLSDEQPRIVYDAYSQAVPILGTQTAGLLDCVHDGRTGWLSRPNDSRALSELLIRAAGDTKALKTMGIEALCAARQMTHKRMHTERHRLLLSLLAK